MLQGPWLLPQICKKATHNNTTYPETEPRKYSIYHVKPINIAQILQLINSTPSPHINGKIANMYKPEPAAHFRRLNVQPPPTPNRIRTLKVQFPCLHITWDCKVCES